MRKSIFRKVFLFLLLLSSIIVIVSCSEEKENSQQPFYVYDELVSISELPTWITPYIEDFTMNHPTGVDIYQGEYSHETIYMIMTIAYNTPYIYDDNGNYIGLNQNIKDNSTKWKRVYSWRPAEWDQDLEKDISVSRFFN